MKGGNNMVYRKKQIKDAVREVFDERDAKRKEQTKPKQAKTMGDPVVMLN